jgi:AcrR family transcriptional regulator
MSAIKQKFGTVRKKKGESADRRALRSRRLIRQALMDLMHTRPFDSITVQDIIDRADVGRSTFYAHFQDKNDLVTQFFEGMMEDLARGAKPDGASGPVAFPLATMLAGLQTQAQARNAWMDSRGREFLFSVGQAFWVRRIEEELQARLPPGRSPRVPLPIAAQMIVGAANALVQWWLGSKMPYPPEEMQAMYDRILQPGIRSALE